MSNQQQATDLKALEMIKSRQESEAALNWSRNSYFLVVMSLLTLAYSQKPFTSMLQLTLYQVIIASLALVLSTIWLLIQYRSSQYIEYYKKTAQDLCKKTNTPELYPSKIKGFEMRRLVYWLPIGFMGMSIVFIVIQVSVYYLSTIGVTV